MSNTFKDPVCGMQVSPQSAADTSTYQGKTYYFCSSDCKTSFDEQPEIYLDRTAAAHGHACC